MIKINELRKEKNKLLSYIQVCTGNIAKLKSRKEQFDRAYGLNKISIVDYDSLANHGIEGKSFEYWIEHNDQLIAFYKERLTYIEKKINYTHQKALSLALGILVLSLLISSVSNDPVITGNVIFGENRMISKNLEISFNESVNYTLLLPENSLNLLLFDGEFIGDYVRVDIPLENKTILFTQIERNSNFSDYCGGICDKTFDKQITLDIDLGSNSTLKLNKVYYQSVSLREFSVEPAKQEFKEPGYGTFDLINTRKDNFTVLVYVEGELSDYMTLNDSLIELNDKDTKKSVYYEIDEPPKTMGGKIIIRYIPKGSFKGITPTESIEISYKKDSFSILPMLVALIALDLIILTIVMLRGKNFENKETIKQ